MWGLFLSFLGWLNLSPVPYIAGVIGTTETALRLLISLFMGYPLAIFYHKYVRQHKEYRHYYSILTGLDMAYFNFGISLYHNIIPPVVLYVTTLTLGPGKNNAIFSFIFNMGYLLVGYIRTESDNYDITWTMPHCVLTLKLIALAFDLWDGQKLIKGKELSENSKKTALVKMPSFVELMGFLYFPACFLVGPLFSFRRYSDFMEDKFPLEGKKEYESKALYKFAQGLVYLISYQFGVSVFSMTHIQSDQFWERSIISSHIFCGLWAHFALYKYISCWLLTEASCIRFGFSYNGTEKTLDVSIVSKWDGCNNIKLITFESATKFQHYIDSFNCNTNYFAAEYVYKRLKFLGNRNLSQFFTLVFLALWHGTQSGYYMTFFNEFIIIFMEKELESILKRTKIYEQMWNNNYSKYFLYALLKMYTIVFMGWSLIPFDVKTFSKWWGIYKSLYFSGFLLFLPWPFVYKPFLLRVFRTETHNK